jgi:anaerobic magnesium-protoporphyrin IX monomethyl ester cyclase
VYEKKRFSQTAWLAGMRILFVYPNKESCGFKPIGISLLSAILKREGHETALFDTTFYDLGYVDTNEELKDAGFFKPTDIDKYDVKKKKVDLKSELAKKISEFQPDVLAVSALSDEVKIGLEISRYAKEINPSIKVIWGNKAATMGAVADECIDFYVKGEGVQALPWLLKNIGRANKTVFSPQKYFQDLDSLPFLDWSIFDDRQFLKQYDGKVLRGGDFMITHGCPNSCTYCINDGYRKLYGLYAGKYIRQYSVDRAIDELRVLKLKWKLEFLKFHDEDFLLKDIDYLIKFCDGYLLSVNLPFTIMTNARSVTLEKVKLIKQMGCVSVSMGFEAGNPIIRQILKRRETKEEIIEATKLLNEYRIRTSSFNMIGLPFDTEETILETIRLNADAQVQYPNVSFFFPLEGTVLRQIAIDYGFYKPNDEEFRTDSPVLKLPEITESELIYYFKNFSKLVNDVRKGGGLW